VEWHQIDLAQPVLSGLPVKVDAVVYLAQSENFRLFPEKAPHVFSVNTAGPLALADYARSAGATSFVYASSGGVYGFGDMVMDEAMPATFGDIGFYAGTKICTEILLNNFKQHFTVVNLRFFFVYGPGQEKSMLIPRLITKVATGESITLDGSEGLRINPIFVDDAVSAIRAALQIQRSETINVAGAEVLSLRQIAEVMGQVLKKAPQFEILAKPSVQLIGDIRKMKMLLAAPKISFVDGIRTMVHNYV
jgi:nucleoside-diphosphate-sugar epimerase